MSLLATAGALGLVGVTAATLGDAPAGAASTSPVASVVVTNTSANPVPVTGAVGVSGTVALSGTPRVDIGNSASTPLYVREVDRLGGEPINVSGAFFVQLGTFAGVNVYTVPAGKILIVEDISGFSKDSGSSDHYVDLVGFADALDFNDVNIFHGANDSFHTFGRQVHHYLHAGNVQARFTRGPADGDLDWTGNIYLSGRLVDDPSL